MDWMRVKRQTSRFSGRIFPDSMLLIIFFYFLKIFSESNEQFEREVWSPCGKGTSLLVRIGNTDDFWRCWGEVMRVVYATCCGGQGKKSTVQESQGGGEKRRTKEGNQSVQEVKRRCEQSLCWYKSGPSRDEPS